MDQAQLEVLKNITLCHITNPEFQDCAGSCVFVSSKDSPSGSPVLLYFADMLNILDLWSFTSTGWLSTKNLDFMLHDFFIPSTFPGSMFSFSYWYASHANWCRYEWKTGNLLNNITKYESNIDGIEFWGFTLVNQSLYYLTGLFDINLNVININNFISGNTMMAPQFTITIPNNITQEPNFLNNNQLLILGFNATDDHPRSYCTKLDLYQVADNTFPKLSSSWDCHDNETIIGTDQYPFISTVVDFDANTQGIVVSYLKNDRNTDPVRFGVFSARKGIVQLEEVIEYPYTESGTNTYFIWGVPLSAKKKFPFDFVFTMSIMVNDDQFYYQLIPILI
jgi:hypothetical protein